MDPEKPSHICSNSLLAFAAIQIGCSLFSFGEKCSEVRAEERASGFNEPSIVAVSRSPQGLPSTLLGLLGASIGLTGAALRSRENLLAENRNLKKELEKNRA